MIIFASQGVVEGAEINVLHKEDGDWIVFSLSDMENSVPFDPDNFVIIEESYLYDRIPNLKGKLDQKDNTTINIDYSTGEINVNPQHVHLGIPTHGAKATRQANADFNALRYFLVTLRRNKFSIFVLVLLYFAIHLVGWFSYIPLFLFLGYRLLILLKRRDIYKSGALNPAIVIDAASHKIASYTDLTKGSGSYPIIRIRKYPLPRKYRVNGAKIPVAGGYQDTEGYPHWNYYEPNPLPTAIGNHDYIKEKINAIPTKEWVLLQTEIDKYRSMPKEGYYPINVESSSWKDVDLDQIDWMQFGEE